MQEKAPPGTPLGEPTMLPQTQLAGGRGIAAPPQEQHPSSQSSNLCPSGIAACLPKPLYQNLPMLRTQVYWLL